jgi:hypothetical protein
MSDLQQNGVSDIFSVLVISGLFDYIVPLLDKVFSMKTAILSSDNC